MTGFDWLRLGGMIARRWPQIDFSTVDIRRVYGQVFYVLPVLPEELPVITDEDPSEFKIEQEEIRMIKWVSGNEKCRTGYGPRSNVLLVSS